MAKKYVKKGYRITDLPFLRTIAHYEEYMPKNYHLQFGPSVRPSSTKARLLKANIIRQVNYRNRFTMLQLTDRGYEVLLENGYIYEKTISRTFQGALRRVAVARAAAMLYGAGVDIFPDNPNINKLWQSSLAKETGKPQYYRALDFKEALFKKANSNAHKIRRNMQSNTRYTGIIDSPDGIYAVYAVDSPRPKFSLSGEIAGMAQLGELLYEPVTKAIFITRSKDAPAAVYFEKQRKGKSLVRPEVYTLEMLDQLSSSEREARVYQLVKEDTNRHLLSADSEPFDSKCIIPATQYGVRILRIMMQPMWRQTLSEILLEPEERKPHGQVPTSDGIDEMERPILFLFDMDVARLKQFRREMDHYGIREGVVYCYKDESDLYIYKQVIELVENWAIVKHLSIGDVETVFGLDIKRKTKGGI